MKTSGETIHLTPSFAFRVLDLAQIYASIPPANAVSLRVFARLGYLPDDSPAARAFADEPDDVTLAVTRARFESTAAATLADLASTSACCCWGISRE